MKAIISQQRIAGNNPAIAKPGNVQATNPIMAPLITTKKIPKEITVMGKVRKTKIGLITALTKPKIKEANTKVIQLSIYIPLMSFEDIQSPQAETNNLIKNFISIKYLLKNKNQSSR